jgi:hypothetical protein
MKKFLFTLKFAYFKPGFGSRFEIGPLSSKRLDPDLHIMNADSKHCLPPGPMGLCHEIPNTLNLFWLTVHNTGIDWLITIIRQVYLPDCPHYWLNDTDYETGMFAWLFQGDECWKFYEILFQETPVVFCKNENRLWSHKINPYSTTYQIPKMLLICTLCFFDVVTRTYPKAKLTRTQALRYKIMRTCHLNRVREVQNA